MPSEGYNPVSTGVLDYIKLLLVLCGILILAYVSIRFLIPRVTGTGLNSSGPVQILARTALEPKKTLYVIKAGSSVLLIGSSESGLRFLKDLDPSEFQAQVQQIDAARGTQFSRVLENWRRRRISS